jgi:hypothetical protein
MHIIDNPTENIALGRSSQIPPEVKNIQSHAKTLSLSTADFRTVSYIFNAHFINTYI